MGNPLERVREVKPDASKEEGNETCPEGPCLSLVTACVEYEGRRWGDNRRGKRHLVRTWPVTCLVKVEITGNEGEKPEGSNPGSCQGRGLASTAL